MLTKTMLCAGIALSAILGPLSAANAQVDGNAFDSCKPHDWLTYAEAVENWDHEALNALIQEPTFRNCEPLLASAMAVICDSDPLACVEPASGGDPDDTPDDDIPGIDDDDDPNDGPFGGDGPFPGQRPGEQLGSENDRTDNSNPGGGDDGGSGGGSGGGTPGTPTGGPRS